MIDDDVHVHPPRTVPVAVNRGDVLFTLGAEISAAARDLARFAAFEARVLAAAKCPTDWLFLRDELGGGK